MKYYFTYKTVNKNNGKFYIGVHATNNINDSYLGSGKYLNDAIQHYGKDSFDREIINFHPTYESALLEESQLVTQDLINSPDCYNLTLGGGMPPLMQGSNHPLFGKKRPDSRERMLSNNPSKGRFGSESSTYNTVIVFDPTIQKNIRVSKNDTRYLAGILKSINKGKITVKDKEGNIFHVEKTDPRYINGELIPNTKGLIMTCPHCNKTGGNSMKRWHFNNCKLKGGSV